MNKGTKFIAMIASTVMSLAFFSTSAYAAQYTVVPKDSLYTISKTYNTTIDTIKLQNKLTSDTIYPGQILYIPSQSYTVQKGDTLYLIAKKHQVSLDSLQKANPTLGNLIYPGQIISLPDNTSKQTVINYSSTEVDLLARLISAEAKGESYDAMVAVGGVVVNRVKSKEWPNTISEVINHVAGGYYQFTPVKNGEIKKAATSDAIRAAWAALYGLDPSNGALFFFDNSSTNTWLHSKAVTAQIDSMIFVK